MNLASILILCALGAAVIAAVIAIIIRRKKGKRCSCSCDSCPYSCKKR